MTATTSPRLVTDLAYAQQAAARLTEAIALLRDVAGDMTILAINDTSGIEGAASIAKFARAAADSADLALMNASNEAKLAARETSNALSPAQQEALGRPCLCYPRCAAEE